MTALGAVSMIADHEKASRDATDCDRGGNEICLHCSAGKSSQTSPQRTDLRDVVLFGAYANSDLTLLDKSEDSVRNRVRQHLNIGRNVDKCGDSDVSRVLWK